MNEIAICKHIDCKLQSTRNDYCSYHNSGGVFGSGETYEQYHIIEQDFIDFIKIVPMTEKENMNVYSPQLRDIIIRSCVQIELFFKEWAKFDCSENQNPDLYKKYNTIDKRSEKIKGARNWNFRDYFPLKENNLLSYGLVVRELGSVINPFQQWITENNSPEWWNVYNAIKHDGINSKKKVNLEIALESVAALFTMHCANPHSRAYLQQFASISIYTPFLRKQVVKQSRITTPLDAKRYLFQDVPISFKADEAATTE